MTDKPNGRVEIPPPLPLSPEVQRLRDWTKLRTAWFSSGFTGYIDGQPLPPLGRRPPDPPRKQRGGKR